MRSSKARRLGRYRVSCSRGPPPRPLVVPGRHWLAATVTGWSGPGLLACCRWWSPSAPGDPRLEPAHHQQTTSQIQVLQELARRWEANARPLHAGSRFPWPSLPPCRLGGSDAPGGALAQTLPPCSTWAANQNGDAFVAADGRPTSPRPVGRWDAHRRCWLHTSLFALPVRLPGGPFAEHLSAWWSHAAGACHAVLDEWDVQHAG